ncbi:MAG TPA: DUF3467 domain-containing protein [Candidatus Saccharimonadales bacterium]|nr:DUF3467 domain-containing protein [Candidatus Saccharimonadales bacterium]
MEQQIQVKASDEVLKGVYCNNMQVSHTKEEFVLDFLNILPPAGQFVARVITNPSHYKRIVNAMQINLELYEKNFGSVEEATALDEKRIGFKTT